MEFSTAIIIPNIYCSRTRWHTIYWVIILLLWKKEYI